MTDDRSRPPSNRSLPTRPSKVSADMPASPNPWKPHTPPRGPADQKGTMSQTARLVGQWCQLLIYSWEGPRVPWNGDLY